MTLPVVWTPEANEDLLEARAWYENIRPELGERFASAIGTTVQAIAQHPCNFQLFIEAVAVPGYAISPKESFSMFRTVG